ncbi:DUF6357 family protein [Leucobacter luti]|uniref:DUF6357 family protein n=1 Tax=Leucobacter luti TaxID=340320 RepID=UPI003CFECEB7
MRALKFSDDEEHEASWEEGSETPGIEAFLSFVREHVSEENETFYIEDEANSEMLALWFNREIAVRVRGSEGEMQEFHVSPDGYLVPLAKGFIHGGYDALGAGVRWLESADQLPDEMYRISFEATHLRGTRLEELRRRLRILSHIAADGAGAPAHAPGSEAVELLGFDTPAGDRVRAAFAPDGRGILTLFDAESTLATPEATACCAELFEGVPAELSALDPGAGTEPVTAVFLFDGPVALSPGLVTRFKQEQLETDASGLRRLLEPFLALDVFSPATLADTTDWWPRAQIARGFEAVQDQEARARASRPVADPEALARLRSAFTRFGSRDDQGTHYVFFAGRSTGRADPERDQLLALLRDAGLRPVANPPQAAEGEVWVPVDPRTEVEFGEGSQLLRVLSRAGLAEDWYRWCDRVRDWSVDAEQTYEQDALRTVHGGFAPLSLAEFMQAYRDAGATATKGSQTHVNPRHRSFTVEVAEGRTTARLEIELGRGLNSEQCAFSILRDGVPHRLPELLHGTAHELMRLRGEPITHSDAPFPRPIISSRSHLEVSAREIVAMMGEVARAWDADPVLAGEIRGDARLFLAALGAREGDPALDRLIAFIGETPGVDVFEDAGQESRYLLFPSSGVEMLLVDGSLHTVFVHAVERSDTQRRYARFATLVDGVTRGSSPRAIVRALGAPVKDSERFLRYPDEQGFVQFDVDGARISMVVFMREVVEAPPQEMPAEITGGIAPFIEAMGSGILSPEHQRLIVLAGPAMETHEEDRGGVSWRTEVFPKTGVLLEATEEVLVGALIRITGSDGDGPAFPEAADLIDGISLPASREIVRERLGQPVRAEEPEGPGSGFDMFEAGGVYLRVDYAGGESSAVAVVKPGVKIRRSA